MQSNMILGGLAAAQVLAVIGVWVWSASDVPPEARRIIAIEADAVDRIVIENDPSVETRTVTLVRAQGSWHLRGSGGPPVDETKIRELLDKVVAAEGRTPVTTTAASHEQLGLSDTAFTRRVTLGAGSSQTVLTMAGGRRSFLRVNDDAAVWPAGELSPFIVATRESDWIEQPYLELDPAAVQTLTLPTTDGPITVVRTDEGWAFDPPRGDLTVDAGFVDRFLGRLKNLRTSGLPKDLDYVPTWSQIAWTADDQGQSRPGSIAFDPAGEQRQTIRAEGRSYTTETGRYTLSDLTDLTLDKLAGLPTDDP